jgi:hypothetical protein
MLFSLLSFLLFVFGVFLSSDNCLFGVLFCFSVYQVIFGFYSGLVFKFFIGLGSVFFGVFLVFSSTVFLVFNTFSIVRKIEKSLRKRVFDVFLFAFFGFLLSLGFIG